MILSRTDHETLRRLAWVRTVSTDGRARQLRLDARFSGSELARLVGVTPATLSRWENGLRTPRGEAAERYAAVLEELQTATQAAS
jgi:transcriptional regulator with XRE-family HTH domain